MNYIVFDLEATCWEIKRDRSEIIEIGAIKTDEHFQVLDAFDTFVRPTTDPQLSTYCTNLTHITQDNVDDAPIFHQALQEFEEWADYVARSVCVDMANDPLLLGYADVPVPAITANKPGAWAEGLDLDNPEDLKELQRILPH